MLEHVDYDFLDQAKKAFIIASRTTLGFAKDCGFVPQDRLGASSNIFTLDLSQRIGDKLHMTLLPEGLGTADDARPADLNENELTSFWHNIGLKTVGCMTNDAATCGARPILISLYLPSAEPAKVFTPAFLDGFTSGFVEGCKTVGCVWLSGETPQLRGKLYENKLDIAGSVFGVVPSAKEAIDGSRLAAGNQIVLVASSGPHENGLTTLRALSERLPQGYRTKLSGGQEFWQAINTGSKLYSPLIQRLLLDNVEVTAIENITGHGWMKLMRSKKNFEYRISEMPSFSELFQFVEAHSALTKQRMFEIFNCGTGYAIFVSTKDAAAKAVKLAKEIGYEAVHAGEVFESKQRSVWIEPFQVRLSDGSFALERD